MPENKKYKRQQSEAVDQASKKFVTLGLLRDVAEFEQDPRKYMELSYKYHKLWLNFCYKNGKRLAGLSAQIRLNGASTIRASDEAQAILKKEFEQELLSKIKTQSFEEIWQEEQKTVKKDSKYLRPIYNHHALIARPCEPQKKATKEVLKNKIQRILENVKKYRQERLEKKKDEFLAFSERAINKGQRSFRLAAFMLPLAGLGYSGYLRTANAQALVDKEPEKDKHILVVSEKKTITKQTQTAVFPTKRQLPKTDFLKKAPIEAIKEPLAQTDSSVVFKQQLKFTLPDFSSEDISALFVQEPSQPDTLHSDCKRYEEAVLLQKDKDLAEFCAQYLQCAHDNYIRLECGNKRKAFRDANIALQHYGFSKISQGLHCSGMSMASLCQAADIFIEKYPQSPVSFAVKDILKNCRNVHSCLALKNDLASQTGSVIRYSENIEADIKQYMKNKKNAIVFVWTKRTKRKFHHQTFFTAPDNSHQAYIYCAYNNQHWGGEQDFSNYMRSRRRYGRGAYFTDIGESLNSLALGYAKKEIACYKEKMQAKNNNLLACGNSFEQTAKLIRQSIFTR